MVDIANTTSDRRGALHQGVLGRRGWDAELEGELASCEGSGQFVHGVLAEDRLSRWDIELGQAKVGAPGVQAHKEVVAVAAYPAAFFVHEGFVGRGNAPGIPLFLGQSGPSGRNSADVLAVVLLLRRPRIVRGHVLARDLAVARLGIDHGALPPTLWNGFE